MRKSSFAIAALFMIAPLARTSDAQGKTTPPLTNSDFVSLVKAGLSNTAIIAKAENFSCALDTSLAWPEELKGAGARRTVKYGDEGIYAE